MKTRIFAILSVIALLATFALPTLASESSAAEAQNGYSESLIELVDLTGIPDIKELTAENYAAGSAWKVTDAAGLVHFSAISRISDTYTFLGKTVYLANDIDMKGVTDFVPISYNGGLAAFVTAFNGGIRFSGTFDGQGHTIRNLVMTSDASDCRAVALFGAIRGGCVRNLVIDSSCSFTYTGTSSYAMVAPVAALLYAYGAEGAKPAWADADAAEVSAMISNVRCSAGVSSTQNYAGGIVASVGSQTGYFAVIRNCTYTGRLSGTVKGAGGIYGCWTETRNLLCKQCVFAGKRTAASSNGWVGDICGQGKPTKDVGNRSVAGFEVVGYQQAGADAGRFSVRFSAVINSIDGYREIGMILRVTDADGNVIKSATQPVECVYTSIVGNVNGKPVTYTASELGGNYIACLVLQNIPENLGELHFSIETYAVTEAGSAVLLDAASVSFNGSSQISE